ncbi:SURF1 family protein [Rhizorhabdus sp.]|uniref:SURF1 family protein n=1 Tax=Rhizorhabdus sp. TaxID=1968843 RepID=UPI0019A05B5E|nr:SURF1 family protein [Rhizorhabdus sp.]MBD3759863.1 SURF1 family protein [Rhizorhabdus sp.]
MRRVPIVPTLIVGLAVATMIALGVWQLHRATWKEGLLASYRGAAHEPALYGLPADLSVDRVAFRRAHILCRITSAPTMIGGSDRTGQPGFRNIVGCALIDGRRIMTDLGWSPPSAKPVLPAIGQRIEGDGLLIPDEALAKRVLGAGPGTTALLLVLDGGVPGLAPSIAPSIETIPNNHRAYAVQWFLFAAVALTIYGIALWKRKRVP